MSGRSRAIIERVTPQVDCGQSAIKRIVGDQLEVEADVFGDGHDVLQAVLRYRRDRPGAPVAGDADWQEIPMTPLVNDRWHGTFTLDEMGTYHYTVVAWMDRALTWLSEFRKRVAAEQVSGVDRAIGSQLITATAQRAEGADRARLTLWAEELQQAETLEQLLPLCDDPELPLLLQRHASRDFASTYDRDLRVTVDRPRAGCSAWYEMFPRSASPRPEQHGTFKDVEARLPYVAAMGFDVLYLPPVHPIGTTFRKGKNNSTVAASDDVGSPWGIGSKEGGHEAIHPQLGTMADFRRLLQAAAALDIEIALDIAFQCSPDHPYVTEHANWFRRRPDGTIQYAENPPKKYQDIYPFDFETEDYEGLWRELKSIFDFWIREGVKIFRVDNPHTKPLDFWEWCIGEIKREHPEVLFLAEAFTRPKIMYRLAKRGFTQSYTYFTWRNSKAELTEYLTELTRTEVADFFRPNFWPNTPDILTEYLQVGGRPAFMSRLVLAAMLSSNYGIYGPPFEHCWSAPLYPGSEEYLHSEKYQVHTHNLDRPDSLKDFIARINRLRREHAILRRNDNLRFHAVDNDEIICFSKSSDDCVEIILVIVNLNPHHAQWGFVELPLAELNLEEAQPFQVHDLLSDARYLWHGQRNFVKLDPQVVPAHIFQIRRRVRSERDFEYYL